GPRIYDYRGLRVRKLTEHGESTLFYFHILLNHLNTAVRFPPQQLQPKLLMGNVESLASGGKKCQWQAGYDFQSVPAGEIVDLVAEAHSSGRFLQRGEDGTALTFLLRAPTAELTMWILMPERTEYRSFRIVRHQTGKPETAEAVKVVTEYLADDYTIIAFKLLSLKPGYTYDVQWYYK